MSAVDITNNTGHLIYLPAVQPHWPDALRLVPGLNRVPKAYLDAIDARVTPLHDENGAPVVRKEQREVKKIVRDATGKETTFVTTETVDEPVMQYPLRAAMEKLFKARTTLVTSSGRHTGTMLTRHAEGTVDPATPEGPPPPEFLPGKDVAAMKIVNRCSDREALARWAENDPRDRVKAACTARLQGGRFA